MTEHRLPPIHPGEILLEEFLKLMNISQYRLAKDISVPARRINEIVQGKRAISADTALRLSRYFGLSERFWMNLQTRYDLEAEKDRLAGSLAGPSRCLALQRRNQPNPYEAPGCQGTKISSERLFCIFTASWIPAWL